MSILKKIDLSPEEKIVADRTWQESHDYRQKTAFPLKTAFDIMNEYLVLKSDLGPSLVSIIGKYSCICFDKY